MIMSKKPRKFHIVPLILAALDLCAHLHAQSTGIYVNSNNNVGIGTTSPETKLTSYYTSSIANPLDPTLAGLNVYGNSSVRLLFGSSPNSPYTAYIQASNTGSGFPLALNPNGGNVGIGTTNPMAAKLAVMGNISFDGSSVNQERIIGLQRADGAGWTNTPHMSFKTDGNGNGYLTFSTLNSGVAGHPDMVTFNYNGNVGIGTTTPAYALDITSTNAWQSRAYIHPANGNEYALLQFSNSGGTSYFGMDDSGGDGLGSRTAYALTMYAPSVPIVFLTGGGERMRINPGGNIGIGTTTPGYMLDVAGQVHATSFVSSTQTYADFVFKPGYKLPRLSDVETAIKKDGHLPGIPSEAEAKAHGIDLASMQVKLLQKIEELTLHQIEQQKLLENQNKRLDAQSQRIEQLEKENRELRSETH